MNFIVAVLIAGCFQACCRPNNCTSVMIKPSRVLHASSAKQIGGSKGSVARNPMVDKWSRASRPKPAALTVLHTAGPLDA
jgi:hypothetical protein